MAGILKVDKYQDFNGNDIMTSDGSGNITINNAALKMTPAFHVNLSSNQSVSDNVATKVEFDREVFDTNSAYDNSTNYRFTVPSGQAGKYHFYFNILTASTALSGADQVLGSFYLNGSSRGLFYGADARSNPGTKFTSYGIITLDLSVGDYVEVYGTVNYNSGAGNISSGGTSRPDESCFGGYKLIGV